jgi:hypothetical protein
VFNTQPENLGTGWFGRCVPITQNQSLQNLCMRRVWQRFSQQVIRWSVGVAMNEGFGLISQQPLDGFTFINIGVGDTTGFSKFTLISQ